MIRSFLLALSFIGFQVFAQEDWDFGDQDDSSEIKVIDKAFFDTRVVNAHSTEVLEKGMWDVRIAHRFGNMATSGAYQTFFGLDNSSDIKIGVEYGVSEKLMIGLHRNKGAGPYSQLMEGIVKYKLLNQAGKMPINLTIAASTFYTIMPSSTDPSSVTYFAKNAHRGSYFSQVVVSKNIANRLSLQTNLGLLYRNFVAFGDVNTALSIGGVAKVKVAPKISLVSEYNHLIRSEKTINDINYADPLGFGVEFKTFAHVFQLNVTNSKGMGEVQYISYTQSRWRNGEIRLGFTISRHF